ncbi:translation initiation factor IF-2 [Sulfurimonas microaerophilic]|uniref:translation initiation factor IF-2 n=1 Tax=Sulfurimonas microaerophilic TaxID=3058392 RepID=UPI0027153F8C|nr:translation initiation factor IF-2 [Sulfurimonas sp. hsl 1-7]
MSEKVRVHEIAKELGITSKDVLEKANKMGIDVKSAQSVVTMEQAEGLANYIMNGEPSETEAKPEKKTKAKTEDKKEATPTKEEPKAKIDNSTTSEAKEEEPVKVATSEEVKEKEPSEDKTADITPRIKPVVKKSGLKIVKKKKQVKEEVYEAPKKQEALVSSYGKMSEEALQELAQKKKNKEKTAPVSKKDQGTKLDIFGGSLADVSIDMDDQVVLLDLNATERQVIEPEEPRKPKQPKPIGRNANKKQAPRARKVSRDKRKKYTKDKPTDEVVTHVEIPEDIRVYEFAEKLKRPMSDIIKVLFDLGMMMTKNDFLGADEIEILSEEFGVEVTIVDPKDEFNYVEEVETEEEGVERPPIITIMGHVDHGKTSLLDAIREAKVTEDEAGGITQHIGAYTISQHGREITFIDTPGHAAFSSMRQRGTDITDIIIIVVAADDGVKPQTEEVIKIAKESGAPIIVALNKMDKETANPDLVKGQMAERGISPVDWGGDIEFVPLSAKTGMGLDDLLENILLTADILELKANPDANAKAAVVESSLEKGRGPVATVIVQNGTLKVGDNVVCGKSHGRVKALINENAKQIKSVPPSHTAVVVGLNEVPAAGEIMMVMKNDKEAKEYAQKRYEYDRHKELSKSTKSTLEDMTSMIAEGKLKSLKVVLKTDVHGSLEAIKSSLSELRNEEVKIDIISSGVGGITESDVELVSNSENCVLLGFNVRPTGSVKALAKQRNVDIRTYSIIYQLLDDMTGMLTGMMAPKFTEENTGQAAVRDVFKSPKGMVAGCVVEDGRLIRGGLVRVIREGVVAFEGELVSLRRFKDDVEEVGNGYECGVIISNYEDVQVGDVIETFKKVEQKVSL